MYVYAIFMLHTSYVCMYKTGWRCKNTSSNKNIKPQVNYIHNIVYIIIYADNYQILMQLNFHVTNHINLTATSRCPNGLLTLGMLSLVQTPSCNNRSLISQANIDGHSRLYDEIFDTTSAVATRGFEPPIARGRIDPVS